MLSEIKKCWANAPDEYASAIENSPCFTCKEAIWRKRTRYYDRHFCSKISCHNGSDKKQEQVTCFCGALDEYVFQASFPERVVSASSGLECVEYCVIAEREKQYLQHTRPRKPRYEESGLKAGRLPTPEEDSDDL